MKRVARGFHTSVVIQPLSHQHLILRFTDFLLVAHSAKYKMKYLSSKFHYLLIREVRRVQEK